MNTRLLTLIRVNNEPQAGIVVFKYGVPKTWLRKWAIKEQICTQESFNADYDELKRNNLIQERATKIQVKGEWYSEIGVQ